MCSKYHGLTNYYQATKLVIVINYLRLFYHGDGSDGNTKYHGHTYYYQQLIGCYIC